MGSDPTTPAASVRRYIEELIERRPDLVMSPEEIDALEAADRAHAHDRELAKAGLRLDALRKQLPEHYAWAEEHAWQEWTAIREKLRSALDCIPSAWVLMGSKPGNAKTTALVAEGIRAIRAGRSVCYVRGPQWRQLALDGLLEPLRTCDLLLADELHHLVSQKDWVLTAAMGVFDGRYLDRKRWQVLGSGSWPIGELKRRLPPGLADRFDVHLGAAEKSQRRVRDTPGLGKGKR